MCSRYIKKQSDLVEKPRIRKTKTMNQVKYPALYSQSWSGPPQNSKKASTNRSSTQKLSSSVRRDTRPQLRCHGPDPTVPHLKYGLFPKKRVQSPTLGLSSNEPLVESDTSKMRKPRIKTTKEVSVDSSEPHFVVCALDSRLGRRLSRAASTHLDIKPRIIK